MKKSRKIKVDYLARVEGEGALYVDVKDDDIDVSLRIFEPPRFFEAFLEGRDFTEAPDITSRICGICPVAYQMSAVHAMEDALGLRAEGALREMRRLLYCGEWVESHVLHIFMLHAPDFLKYHDAMEMGKDHPDIVKLGLRMKKVGNEIVRIMGGREIHPINIKVGGFYKAPRKADFKELRKELEWAHEAAIEAYDWICKLPIPQANHEYQFVSLSHPDEYPFNEGRLISSSGLDISPAEYEDHFHEEHVSHSNALHCLQKDGSAYFVGPTARLLLNLDKLPAHIRSRAESFGISRLSRNPFTSIIARILEVMYAFHEAMRIIDNYNESDYRDLSPVPKKSIGYAITEAPRGTLYHRYELDKDGLITKANIVPPTSQNQKTIEADLYQIVKDNMHLEEADLQHRCEQAIRNYDPCISCSTHFLKLKFNHEDANGN